MYSFIHLHFHTLVSTERKIIIYLGIRVRLSRVTHRIRVSAGKLTLIYLASCCAGYGNGARNYRPLIGK